MKKSLFLVLALLVFSCSSGQKKAEQEEQARLEQKKEQAVEAKEAQNFA